MTLEEIKLFINERIKDLEISSHSEVTSRDLYEQRMAALIEIVNVVEDGIEQFQDDSLIALRNRIMHSIRILELAEKCGVVKEA